MLDCWTRRRAVDQATNCILGASDVSYCMASETGAVIYPSLEARVPVLVVRHTSQTLSPTTFTARQDEKDSVPPALALSAVYILQASRVVFVIQSPPATTRSVQQRVSFFPLRVQSHCFFSRLRDHPQKQFHPNHKLSSSLFHSL